MISRLLCFQYPKFYAVRLSQFSRAWSLVASLQNTKDVWCIDVFVWLHCDSSMETIKRKLYANYKLMIFHRWLRHDHAWLHNEKVSGTERVAQYSLHILWYVQMVDYGCYLSRILTLLSSIVTLRFGTCSRSTRPLSCTRLFKKMQRMSVRDLDKMKPFHEKKEWGFQIHSFKRNDDNLSQTGRSQTCRQTCSWCPATS